MALLGADRRPVGVEGRLTRPQGVEIIPTPSIELSRLLTMAIKKIRPFEEKGEKGFRDSVILFSILEHARGLDAGYHVVISGDEVFSHPDIAKLASEHGVDLRVCASIADVNEHLEQFLTEAVKTYRAGRVQRLLSFLRQQHDRIEAHIRSTGEFTSAFVQEGRLFRGALKEIESIHLLTIDNAQPGLLPEGVNRGRVEISFTAKIKFVVLLGEYARLPNPTFRVGESEMPRTAFPIALGEEQTTKQEIEQSVMVRGSANLVRASDAYSDLELEPVRGSTLVDALLGL